MTKSKNTKVDEYLNIVKNYRPIAILIVIGIIVIAIGEFTDACSKIGHFFGIDSTDIKPQITTPSSLIPKPKLVGRVIDIDTKAPVYDAAVTLETKDVPSETRTDSKGIFSFPIDEHTGEVRIRIKAAGYEDFDQRIVPSSNMGIEDFRIRLLQKVPELKPKSGNSEGNNSIQNKPEVSSQVSVNVPIKKKFEFEISSTIYEDGVKIYIDHEKVPRATIKGGAPTFLQLEEGMHFFRATKTLKDNSMIIYEKQIFIPESLPLILDINQFDKPKEMDQ